MIIKVGPQKVHIIDKSLLNGAWALMEMPYFDDKGLQELEVYRNSSKDFVQWCAMFQKYCTCPRFMRAISNVPFNSLISNSWTISMATRDHSPIGGPNPIKEGPIKSGHAITLVMALLKNNYMQGFWNCLNGSLHCNFIMPLEQIRRILIERILVTPNKAGTLFPTSLIDPPHTQLRRICSDCIMASSNKIWARLFIANHRSHIEEFVAEALYFGNLTVAKLIVMSNTINLKSPALTSLSIAGFDALSWIKKIKGR